MPFSDRKFWAHGLHVYELLVALNPTSFKHWEVESVFCEKTRANSFPAVTQTMQEAYIVMSLRSCVGS